MNNNYMVVVSAAIDPTTPVSITLTMDLRDWKIVRARIREHAAMYETLKVVHAIDAAVEHIEKRYEFPIECDI